MGRRHPRHHREVDYLDSLGVDVVWLCPVYDSPNADNGYDIRDYRAIADEFGTMADWEELLAELYARDVRLVMDLVINHTSDEHDWFRRSRRPRDVRRRRPGGRPRGVARQLRRLVPPPTGRDIRPYEAAVYRL